MSKTLFDRVAIVGVGLIGGSLGLELIRKKLVKEVVGYSRSAAGLKLALRKKLITEAAPSLFEAVVDADCVIVAAPVMATLELLPEILTLSKPGTLVMDVGSTKEVIVEWAKKYCPEDVTFIGAHPMAGSERSGPESAVEDLFQKRHCFLAPAAGTDPRQIKKATKLWQSVGMKVKTISARQHDEIVGGLSHLPQLMAYVLMNTVEPKKKVLANFSGSGLRDTTRLAASDPKMWVDICMTNKRVLLSELAAFSQNLKKVSDCLETDNYKALEKYFTRSNTLKKMFQ